MPPAATALAVQGLCLVSGSALAQLTGWSQLYSVLYAASFLIPAYLLAAERAAVNEMGFGLAYLATWLVAKPLVDCAVEPFGGFSPACIGDRIHEGFGPRIALVSYSQFLEGFANALDFLINAIPYAMAKTFQAAFGVNSATVALSAAATFIFHANVALISMGSLRRR